MEQSVILSLYVMYFLFSFHRYTFHRVLLWCKIWFTDLLFSFMYNDVLKCRGFSTFHAIVVAAASLYLLIVSDLFNAASQDELIINRTSTFSDTILGVSCSRKHDVP